MPISIAIVEDMDDIREGLRNYIEHEPDFEMLCAAADAAEALVRIPRLRPDIVIMDINLPDTNGIECMQLLKSDCPRTQFMMFTVYENDEKVFQALEAGASGYLLKHSSPSQIMESLRELYNGGSPMSPNIARKLVNLFREEHKGPEHSDLLGKRENEILHLLAQGLLYKEIANRLSISVGTVRQHIHNIYEKLHVQNRTEALNKAFRK